MLLKSPSCIRVSAQVCALGLVAAIAPADVPCVEHWDTSIGQPGLSDVVFALAQFNDDLIAGGAFTIARDGPGNRVARWDGSTWHPLGDGVGDPPWSDVLALAVYNGQLIAGGSFTSAGGEPANRIARWDGSQWHPLDDGMNNTVFALTIYNGDLIAGGSFTTAGGISATGIARWDGSTWSPVGGGVDYGPFTPAVRSLIDYNGDLIAGGVFSTAGGVTVNHIARWDGSEWHALGSGVSAQAWGVMNMTVFEGELIVGGDFWDAGVGNTRAIARWDGTAWHALEGGSLQEKHPYVAAVQSYAGQLYVGGLFWSAGGVSGTSNIARWDGSGWQSAGGGLPGDWPEAMIEHRGALIIGGWINPILGLPASGVVSWHGCPPECAPPDLNCDGVVDIFDLLFVLANWGECDNCPAEPCAADVNDDCVVDIFDLLFILANWG